MLQITKKSYPNVLDAVRFYYKFSGAAETVTPIAFALNVNKIYLDRLEGFIADELDLPEFYAFVEGRKGKFTRYVAFPMAQKTLQFILESLEGKNTYETGPKISTEIQLPPVVA